MKRKITSVVCAAALAVCAVGFVACDKETPHEHSFSSGWTSDATHHWHTATCEHTDEQGDKALHIFDGDKCIVCEYEKKSGSTEPETPPHDKHTFVNYVYNNDATCSADGTETAKCTGCDETDTRTKVGSRTDHIYVNYQCKFCETLDPNAPIAQGLTFGEVIGENTEVIGYEVTDCSADVADLIIIPSEHDGKPVVGIAECAFDDKDIRTVVIPNTVEYIGITAFRFSGLTSVRIPHSVKSIGVGAFMSCTGLTNIIVPDSVEEIGEGAFACGNYGVSSVLTSLSVEEGNARYAGIGNCIVDTQTKTLVGACGTSVLPTDGSIEKIGAYTFMYCDKLTQITIPNGVTEIAESAFCGCENLSIVYIPKTVAAIADSAFMQCEKLVVEYAGTIEEWHAIRKIVVEDTREEHKVKCTNGETTFFENNPNE